MQKPTFSILLNENALVAGPDEPSEHIDLCMDVIPFLVVDNNKCNEAKKEECCGCGTLRSMEM
jgi:hypothetical protein